MNNNEINEKLRLVLDDYKISFQALTLEDAYTLYETFGITTMYKKKIIFYGSDIDE